ncbi:hypothetical protein EDM52_20025 [Brevibacillus invocatus]|uniref:Uncharacterized protein n=1 Tax=Brevibacillus invocatus TaxID=173959 RepID=A0A3M8BYT2_9BACL|nr:hypothetical protein [Brevibacillus invocatus]EAO7496450.1 hypothetical protein [Salmonella enterica]RNB68600.1 hypothetical protein EDM52_20025 [Brevibacillus invocatus]
MKKKIVLVLDVDIKQNADMQGMADAMSKAIQSVDDIVLHELVMIDNDETSADKLIASVKSEG